ncbi:MAG: hypothetical protein KDA45_07790 [Planctomycetales bacterium]|nr:hypothetical protein [Planctomycetales bacterium]
MHQPSKQIADRYRLQLSPAWQTWFDTDSQELQPAGAFQTVLSAESLAVPRPAEIWPGFMLPDTLPVLGNEYGDWICVRVLADGGLGELLHWYHGGGDWVPLGQQLPAALVHDVIDQFRPVGRQMLRGASETILPDHLSRVLAAFAEPRFRQWLSRGVAHSSLSPSQAVQVLDQLERLLQEDNYRAALQILYEQQWSIDAVACDLIEHGLQRPIAPLADPALAQTLQIPWTPDYVRCLFDIEYFSLDARERLSQAGGLHRGSWPRQDWQQAAQLAQNVLDRRQDLGWAFDIAGWNQQRQGDGERAAACYFAGRHASAFSDQAVRMRTHWIEPRFGKFTIDRLAQLREQLPLEHQRDPYLQLILQASSESERLRCVSDFWYREGQQHLAQAAFADAYGCFYRAGWDMGAERLTDYPKILEGLVGSARGAGWAARSAVAQTHLDCFLGKR